MQNCFNIGIVFWFFCFACYGFESEIVGIDSIYLINLDRRPDRLEAVNKELEKFDLYAKRICAVDGRGIEFERALKLALPYAQGMADGRLASVLLENGQMAYEFLNQSLVGKPVFSELMNLGGIGCALSHLSVLKEAYDSGYETIWVLEDDICVKKDPHILACHIVQLDIETDGNWDVLYTDSDTFGRKSPQINSFWWMWRPDMDAFDLPIFTERTILNEYITKIRTRTCTHSMIIRRSGMKKILDYFANYHFYLPIDLEIGFVPDIQLFMTSYPIVTTENSSVSDIRGDDFYLVPYGESDWELYKRFNLENIYKFPGWCDLVKANHLMNFIIEYQPKMCVEIGTYGGSTSFPILLALKYLDNGHLFTIDAWENSEAVIGFKPSDKCYSFWKTLDFQGIKNVFINQIDELDLNNWCTVLNKTSYDASNDFIDNTIDMLYIDGNFSERGITQDLIKYYPKVKNGGYIWINDSHYPTKVSTIKFLSDEAVYLKDESLENRCIVFQKKSVKNPLKSEI